jgi:hypothetical protein
MISNRYNKKSSQCGDFLFVTMKTNAIANFYGFQIAGQHRNPVQMAGCFNSTNNNYFESVFS